MIKVAGRVLSLVALAALVTPLHGEADFPLVGTYTENQACKTFTRETPGSDPSERRRSQAFYGELQINDQFAMHTRQRMGNKHTAKARELSWQERKARQTHKLVDPRTDDNALPTITH
jgi:hypothetical protein